MGQMNPVAYCPKGGRFGPIGPNPPKGGTDKTKPIPNTSYGINPNLVEYDWFQNDDEGGSGGGQDSKAYGPLGQIQEPGKVCLWIEAIKNRVYTKRANVTGPHFSKEKIPPGSAPPVEDIYPVWVQHGRANVVYIDQHMAWKKVEEEIPDWNSQFWKYTETDKPDPDWK